MTTRKFVSYLLFLLLLKTFSFAQSVATGDLQVTVKEAAGNLPEWAAAEAIHYLQSRVSGHGGIILLDARGRFGIAHNTPRMAWAIKARGHEDSSISRPPAL